MPETPTPEDYAQSEQQKDTIRTLTRQLAKARAKTEDFIDAVYRAARDSWVVEKAVATPRPERVDKRKHSAEVALWHMTDWQGAKLTTTYNSEVMVERAHRFVDAAQRITDIQRQDHPVRECVILFGGDMVEGLWNFPTQAFEVDATLFRQWTSVSRLLTDVVRRALGIYDTVRVVAEWGNHGRLGSKRDAIPRSDNYDRVCYETARMALAAESRLNWDDCPEDIQRVEVGNYRALLVHGDEVGRTGFASAATMIQHVNRWRSGAYPWPFTDCYVGHYHRHAEEPLADGVGAIYWTGSTESDNRYAGVTMAASAQPSQRLHFVDPEKGRVTAQYKVWVG